MGPPAFGPLANTKTQVRSSFIKIDQAAITVFQIRNHFGRHVELARGENRVIRFAMGRLERRFGHGFIGVRLRAQTQHPGSKSFVDGRRRGSEFFEICFGLRDDLGFVVRQE
jgi:hypothetical protein